MLRLAAFAFLAVAGAWIADRVTPSEGAVGDPRARLWTPAQPLPPNEWIEIRTVSKGLPFHRTDHGGAVYDSYRNSVLLFGSDDHLRSFDNRIQELKLDEMRWYQPYERTPRYTMQTDVDGNRTAGGRADVPWPMHVYDSMVYDRSRRSLVVLSGAQHSFLPAPGPQRDPVWAYAAGENRWSTWGVTTVETPNFFAAGAAYDPVRDAIVAYGALAESEPFVALGEELSARRTGVWELGPDRTRWQFVSSEIHHRGWFNVEFDVANRALLVFGGENKDSSIWLYKVGSTVGEAGRWERRRPEGDSCPGGYYFPAAYDAKAAGTLYLPYDPDIDATVTCFYDASKNLATRLAAATPRVGLNYTMVYVESGDYFLMLSGSYSRGEPTRVWVLKLDLGLDGSGH